MIRSTYKREASGFVEVTSPWLVAMLIGVAETSSETEGIV